MKQKILITGATGFLGKNLSGRLHEDTIYTKKFDLTKKHEVFSKINEVKPDLVYHLGALVDLTRSFDIARNTIEANIVGTTNLLLALETYPAKKFIFASTEEVYGEGTLPFSEDDSVNPPSPYAATKVACEHLVRMYTGKSFQTCLIFRMGTMYGSNQPGHRFIVQMLEKALKNEDIPLHSGTKKRDYIYVGDVVDALISAKDRDLNGFDIFNIGSGTMISLKQLAEYIINVSGSSSRLQMGSIPDRIGEADEWLMDISKAKKILGWEPKTDIQTGIKETIVWMKKQQ